MSPALDEHGFTLLEVGVDLSMVGGEGDIVLCPNNTVSRKVAVQLWFEDKNACWVGIGLDNVLDFGAVTLTPSGKLYVDLPIILLRCCIPGEKPATT